jgi:hypothetical protein
MPPRKPQISLADLNQMLGEASAEEKAEFASQLPIEVTRKMTREDMRQRVRAEAKARQNNEVAQMIVLQHGSCIHPPGFEPKPPEWVSEMGDEAVEHWVDNWYSGKAPRSMEMFRREWGDGNANIGEVEIGKVEAMTDTPEAVLVGGAGGDTQSYLSMAEPAPDSGDA